MIGQKDYGTICKLAAPVAPPATDARTVTDPRNEVDPTLKVAVDTPLYGVVTVDVFVISGLGLFCWKINAPPPARIDGVSLTPAPSTSDWCPNMSDRVRSSSSAIDVTVKPIVTAVRRRKLPFTLRGARLLTGRK
jgi:hypothetical protein